MRIIRQADRWSILQRRRDEVVCLHQLAMRHGYRIGELCCELGCSGRYLYSVFNRDIGVPPKVWMRIERMAVARRELSGGKLPAEVAEELEGDL